MPRGGTKTQKRSKHALSEDTVEDSPEKGPVSPKRLKVDNEQDQLSEEERQQLRIETAAGRPANGNTHNLCTFPGSIEVVSDAKSNYPTFSFVNDNGTTKTMPPGKDGYTNIYLRMPPSRVSNCYIDPERGMSQTGQYAKTGIGYTQDLTLDTSGYFPEYLAVAKKGATLTDEQIAKNEAALKIHQFGPLCQSGATKFLNIVASIGEGMLNGTIDASSAYSESEEHKALMEDPTDKEAQRDAIKEVKREMNDPKKTPLLPCQLPHLKFKYSTSISKWKKDIDRLCFMQAGDIKLSNRVLYLARQPSMPAESVKSLSEIDAPTFVQKVKDIDSPVNINLVPIIDPSGKKIPLAEYSAYCQKLGPGSIVIPDIELTVGPSKLTGIFLRPKLKQLRVLVEAGGVSSSEEEQWAF